MAFVKTDGATFKRFYLDEKAWPDGQYHDDVCFRVNGKSVDGVETDKLADTDTVEFEGGGVVSASDDDLGSFDEFFSEWLSRQDTVRNVFECSPSVLEAVKAAIVAAGGRVV